MQFCLDVVGSAGDLLHHSEWQNVENLFLFLPFPPVLPGGQVFRSVLSLVRSAPLTHRETTRKAPLPTTLALMLVNNLAAQSGKIYPCQSHFHLIIYACSSSFRILNSEGLHMMEARPGCSPNCFIFGSI